MKMCGLRLARLLICLWLLCAPATLHAQNDPLPFADYVQRLLRATSDLRAGVDLATVSAALEHIEAVQLPNGDTLPVTSPLLGVTTRAQAITRLDTLTAQLQASSQDRADVRLARLDRLIEILALDRPTLWQRFWRWVEDLLDALRPRSISPGVTSAAEIASTVLVWAIVISGGALLAVMLSYWLRRLLAGFVADARLRRARGEDDLPQTAAEARTQAQTLAVAGDYRQAVRRLYLSALLHLDESDLLRFRRDQTNREVLRSLPSAAPIRPHLEPVVETFDRVWYGIREPDKATFDAYQIEIDRLMAATAEKPRE